MNKKLKTPQINKSLNRAVDQLPQPSLKKIIDTPVTKMEQMDAYTTQEPLKSSWFNKLCSPVTVRRVAAVFGCLLFFFATGIGGVYSYENIMVDSIVDMDINPSFELKINKKNRVLTFTPLNEDAVQAAEGRTYKDWNIEDAVKDLYRIMEEKGYVTDDRKTVLITVENKNPNRVSQLQSQLSDCIMKTAAESKKTVRIVTQEKKKDQALDQAAMDYHISSGKLQFIRKMTAAYPELDEKALSKMSMEELYRIILEREKEKPVWLQMDEEDWNEYKEEMRKAKYNEKDSADDRYDDDLDNDGPDAKDSDARDSDEKTVDDRDSDDKDSDSHNADEKAADARDSGDKDTDDHDSGDKDTDDHDSGDKDTDDHDSGDKDTDDHDSGGKDTDARDSDDQDADSHDTGNKSADIRDSDKNYVVGHDSDDKDSGDPRLENKDSEDRKPEVDDSDHKDSGSKALDNDDSEDEPDDD